jgi:hypothetical protein
VPGPGLGLAATTLSFEKAKAPPTPSHIPTASHILIARRNIVSNFVTFQNTVPVKGALKDKSQGLGKVLDLGAKLFWIEGRQCEPLYFS